MIAQLPFSKSARFRASGSERELPISPFLRLFEGEDRGYRFLEFFCSKIDSGRIMTEQEEKDGFKSRFTIRINRIMPNLCLFNIIDY